MKVLKFTLFFAVLVFGALSLVSFEEKAGYAIGDKVTDFSLKNVDGNMVSLKDFVETKGFIIVFTCNHCPYSKQYEQRIIDLNKKYAPQGFPVIAINPNDPSVEPEDSFEEMVKRWNEKQFGFPYLFDEGQKVYPIFGATKTPHTFVLSKKTGGYYVEYIGAIDDNNKEPEKVTARYVEEAINALLKGEKPAVSTTKALGCSIKVKK
jgi:glutathione peroxidase-family protein